MFNERTFAFYKNIFLIKKIQTIQSFITICSEYHDYCFESNETFAFDHESIMLPFKSYISEYIVQMV